MAEYSDYQQKAIKRYYDNRDQIDEQKLAELVTNLYLASGKKRTKLWETARDRMLRMGVKQARVDHIIESDDPTLLAAVVEDIQKGKI